MKIDQDEKSLDALYLLRGEKADISQEIADIKAYTEYSKRSYGYGFLSLFQRHYAHCLIIGVGLMVVEAFGGISGVLSYASTILHSAGFSSTIGSIIIGVTEILAAIIGVCFIDKFGRRTMLLTSAAGICLGCILLGLSFFLQNLQIGEEHTPILALVGLLVYLSFFSIGVEGIPWIIVSEIFPINVKGPAGSIINVISSISSWIVSYSFSFIFEWSSTATFFIFAAICGASILFIWKMVPETKGRTLEEIQASIIKDPCSMRTANHASRLE
ncbi:Major facilitator, sugar transporter-like, partial [Trema orientale]